MVTDMINYRYELKYVISSWQAAALKQQLKAVMELDSHSVSTEYSYDIRSLYFDDINNSAYLEKMDGVEFRAKYRLRIYNYSSDVIKLECKHKDENMTYKQDCTLPLEVAKAILAGKYLNIKTNNRFLQQFLADAVSRQLKPAVIVDYRRTAFTYPVSEVRITFDEDLRSGRYGLDFFNKEMPTFPIYDDDQLILEVKCNEFIPDHILAVLNTIPKFRQAFSKFTACSQIK